MDCHSLSAGDCPPEDILAVIEIPAHSPPVKYEIDKNSSALFVDRFVSTSMTYPANYGYIPQTLADDGDPLDVLVITPCPVVPGSVVRCRPVGMLQMADEKGQDEKIIAVPVRDLTELYEHVQEYSDLPALLLKQIEHFFEHYKDLEPRKWVKVEGWKEKSQALDLISKTVAAGTNSEKN
ncbi:MAG: inorganic diphosphatase [Kistimonas sp.]|nr:inorganic diphosphatase [Kistimonas sp.]